MPITHQTVPSLSIPLRDAGLCSGSALAGKRAEHRVLSPEWLYTPILLNNAPIDFIFGVDKL